MTRVNNKTSREAHPEVCLSLHLIHKSRMESIYCLRKEAGVLHACARVGCKQPCDVRGANISVEDSSQGDHSVTCY
eukprot:2843810-Amphidinium_carterae.1